MLNQWKGSVQTLARTPNTFTNSFTRFKVVTERVQLLLTIIPKVVFVVDATDQYSKGCKNMTCRKDAVVLLNDLEEFADIHEYPEVGNLIAKARMALRKDRGNEFPPVRKSRGSSQVYFIQ